MEKYHTRENLTALHFKLTTNRFVRFSFWPPAGSSYPVLQTNAFVLFGRCCVFIYLYLSLCSRVFRWASPNLPPNSCCSWICKLLGEWPDVWSVKLLASICTDPGALWFEKILCSIIGHKQGLRLFPLLYLWPIEIPLILVLHFIT